MLGTVWGRDGVRAGLGLGLGYSRRVGWMAGMAGIEEGDVGLEGILLCWLGWTGKGGCGWMPCRGVSTYAWDGRETTNLRAGARE